MTDLTALADRLDPRMWEGFHEIKETVPMKRTDLIAASDALRSMGTVRAMQWQPIETAPHNTKLLAGFRNEAREEMVEKLARIMWIDTSDKDYWDHVDDHTRNIYRSNAVAVLAVLMPEESRTIVEKE